MNALINLKDCKEYMIIKLNNKDHQISAEGAGCAKRIKLAGTIEDPYFCGRDVCEILGYSNIQKALYENTKNKYKKDLKTLYELHPPKGATH
jgi:prophage antirepressor-like protein